MDFNALSTRIIPVELCCFDFFTLQRIKEMINGSLNRQQLRQQEREKINELAQNIREKIEELKRVCEGLDENTTSSAPAGRWSPKEILSHLLGPEESDHMQIL
jgi:hypothetical protein